ncbi:MAG TPA: MFS transporter [Candidatus Limnocylindrales bacterium]
MRWLRVLYLWNGLVIGAMYGFVPVLLQSKGFAPALIGVTCSLGSVAYTLVLPIWGHVGDVVTGPRRALQIACVPAAIAGLMYGQPLPVIAIVLCQVLMNLGGGPLMALTDAMAMPILANATREYTRLRLILSFGAGGGGIVFGLLYGVVGYGAAPYIYVAIIVSMIVFAQLVPLGRDSERHRRTSAQREGRAHVEGSHGRFGSVGEAFRIQPRLVAILLAVTCGFIGIMAATTFVSLRIADLGGGAAEVGMVNGLGSGAEVPGLVIAGFLVARFGARSVLMASSLGFAICLLSWVFLVDTAPILITRFISGIFFSGVLVSYVLTIARMLPAGLQSTGQTLLQACCYGGGAILANFLGGILYGTMGPIGVFGGGAICALLGGVIGYFALPDLRNSGQGVHIDKLPAVAVAPLP